MEKQKYEIQFVKPEDVFNRSFHSVHPEIVIQKMMEAGFVVLDCKKAKKED